MRETISGDTGKFTDRRIFIIDDEQLVVDFVVQILEAAGFKDIHGFTQSTEALELLRFVRPDLIVTDIHMPELGGTFFAKMVRDFPHINGAPIIAMTADDSRETYLKAKQNGMFDVILKPIKPQVFIQKITSVLRLSEHESKDSDDQTSLESLTDETRIRSLFQKA